MKRKGLNLDRRRMPKNHYEIDDEYIASSRQKRRKQLRTGVNLPAYEITTRKQLVELKTLIKYLQGHKKFTLINRIPTYDLNCFSLNEIEDYFVRLEENPKTTDFVIKLLKETFLSKVVNINVNRNVVTLTDQNYLYLDIEITRTIQPMSPTHSPMGILLKNNFYFKYNKLSDLKTYMYEVVSNTEWESASNVSSKVVQQEFNLKHVLTEIITYGKTKI